MYATLLLVFFLEYTRPHDLVPIILQLKLYSVLPVLLFVASQFAKGATTSGVVWQSRQSIILMCFIVLMTLAIPLGWNSMMATEMLTSAVGYFLLFFMVARLTDTKAKIHGLYVALILIHIYLIIRNPDIILTPEIRDYVQGGPFLGDGNDFALSLVLVLPFCLYFYVTSTSRVVKSVAVFFGAVLLFSIVGTQSRGAALALVGLAVYLWSQSDKKAIGLLITVLVAGVVIVFASDVYLGRLATISNYEHEGSAMGRINAWKAAIWMANHNPVFGVGAGGFPMAHATYYSGEFKAAHSMYFHVLGEYGYVGIILLLTYLISMYRRNQRIMKYLKDQGNSLRHIHDRALFLYLNASLVGFSIAAAFLSVFYYPHIYILGAIFVSANELYRRTYQEFPLDKRPTSGVSLNPPNPGT